MTPEQLKASILQYAIQGKLVEQRAEEGTGEELYRQIQAEKQRLIQEKKIKKEKPLAEISKDEIPFDIPEAWMWCRFGDLIQIINGDRGKNYPSKDKLLKDGNIPFISTINIENNTISKDNLLYLSQEQYDLLGSGKLLKGDLVLCIRGSLGKNGVYPFETGAIASSLVIVRSYVDVEILYQYISLYFNTPLFKQEINNYNNGTAQPNLGARDLAKFEIPLPPLAEQKHIVAKIEELLPLIDRYAASYEKLEQFNAKFPEDMKKSILQYAIQGNLVEQRAEEGTGEELYQQIQAEKQRLIAEKKIKKEKPLAEISEDEIPFDIPESWKWVKVGNIGSWSSGATPSRTNPAYYGGTIPWLKTGDLNDGFIKEIPEFITDLALEKTSVRLNPVGSVLMAMYGATIGKLGILDISATTNQACCACIPYEGIHNKYLFYFLMSMRRSYIGMAEGGAQPNISKEKIVNSLIPLPPLAEQKRIVAKIEEVLPFCDRLKEGDTK